MHPVPVSCMFQDSQIVNESKFFSMEKVQLINAEEMIDAQCHYFATPDE